MVVIPVGGIVIDVEFPGIFKYVTDLISNIFGRLPVRIFFFISGFFFFYKTSFTAQAYKNKLRNRIKTLLIPYLSWNIMVLLAYFIAQNIPGISGLFSGANKAISDYGFKDFLAVFWNTIEGDKPLVYPFWFMRDLMVVSICSPLVYLLVKYTRIFGIIALGSVWLAGFDTGIVGISIVSFFFFSVGAYFSIHKLDPIAIFRKTFTLSTILYPALVIAELTTRGCWFNAYIHNFAILAGIVLVFNLVSYSIEKGKLATSAFLASSSFFLYAFHEPFMTLLRKFIIKFITVTPANLTVLYFVLPIIVILVAVGLYYLLSKYLPRFTAFITGGRIT